MVAETDGDAETVAFVVKIRVADGDIEYGFEGLDRDTALDLITAIMARVELERQYNEGRSKLGEALKQLIKRGEGNDHSGQNGKDARSDSQLRKDDG